MDRFVSSDELMAQLKKLIANVPDNCTKVVLTLEVGKAASMEATTIVKTGDGDTVTVPMFYLLISEKPGDA